MNNKVMEAITGIAATQGMETDRKTTATDKEKKLDELIAKYEALTAESRKKAVGSPKDEEAENWLNETVEIKFFKDGEKYKDDIDVSVNGLICRIKRGVWVKIKRKYALVLDQSEIQDTRTAEMMDAKADEFASETAARSL